MARSLADNIMGTGIDSATANEIANAIGGSVTKSSVGQPGGPAGPLDSGGEIPLGQMPIDGLNYQGTWDASTNTPTLAAGTGTAGDLYRVSAAGSQDLGEGSTEFEIGDHIIYEGAVWQKVSAGGVLSVNGDAGPDVTLTASDVGVTAANPSANVGPAAVDGTATTFMRSDAAPAIDLTADYAWTGTHKFEGVSTDTVPSVEIASSDPQLELRNTGASANEERWNWSTDPDQLSLTALSDDGNTVGTAWIITRSGANVTAHSIQAGGNPLLEISAASDIVASAELHMSGLKIVDVADPASGSEAATKNYVDTNTFSGDYGDLSNRPIAVTSGTVQLELAGEELSWPTDVQTGKIRLYNTTPGSDNTFYGIGVSNGVQAYQVDSNTSKHVFQGVDGSDNATTIAELSHDAGIVAHTDVHMSDNKIINMTDGTNARDAVNLSQLDGRLTTAQRTAIDALTTGSGATVDDVINALQAT